MSQPMEVSSAPSLRIAVVGLGGIGSALAFQLARVGRHEVTAVVRPMSLRFAQLQRDGGIVASNGERAEVGVVDALDEQTPYDLVIVTVLAHQVDAVLPSLLRSAALCVLFMFNSFDPERLRDALGSARCAFGMPFLQAFLATDGKLNARIGSQKSKLSEQRWVDVFVAAGLPALLEAKMLLWLRCHVPLCIAFESISVAAVRRGGGASWGEAMVRAHGLRESFALVEGLGYRLYPGGLSVMRHGPVWVVAAMLWAVSRIRVFRELLATGAGECRALVDVLVAAAPRANPPVAVAKIESMKPSDEIQRAS